MNLKVTLSDITVNFTPDEWGKFQRLCDFAVRDIEAINAAANDEPPPPW
jgi:hypothetical protein